MKKISILIYMIIAYSIHSNEISILIDLPGVNGKAYSVLGFFLIVIIMENLIVVFVALMNLGLYLGNLRRKLYQDLRISHFI